MAEQLSGAVRLSGPETLIVAAATDTVIYTKGTAATKRTVLKKLMWYSPAQSILLIGYTTLGGAFTQVLPDILMLAGVHDGIPEQDLPLCGNTPTGFIPDTTAGTGTLGDIVARASVAGAGAAAVRIRCEVEEE